MQPLIRNKEKRLLDIVIITSGLSSIVAPIVHSAHQVTGIIDCPPRLKTYHLGYRAYQFLLSWHGFLRRTPLTLAGYAKKMRMPYYCMNHGSNSHLEKWVKSLAPDLIVVYSMSQLLKANIYSIPRYGTINLHPSLLPNYRGPNPWFWMCFHMELSTGVTVHYIDEGEDTGDIISQHTFEIPLGIKFADLEDLAIKKHGVQLLIETINKIASGAAPRIAQPRDSPTARARNLNPEDYIQIIDWSKLQIEHIWHVLRSTQKPLTAILQLSNLLDGRKWTVENYVKSPMKSYIAGKIYKENKRYFIACKDGKIFLDVRWRPKHFIKNIFIKN